jgi:formylglycine-generating enzyme required for sulfatase activity
MSRPAASQNFPELFPPFWASAWGEDAFGPYAEFQVAGVTQRCRWMPPGSFSMGSPIGEEGRLDREGPQHEVTLSGFWLADTACSQALWQAVLGDNPSSFKDDPQNPVETVSWDEVQRFCARLNALVPGLAVGLPTEAQWEYACRAGTEMPFSCGQAISKEQANFGGELMKTVAVGSLPPNPWGLYEMHGNVWEWCADWFGPYAAAAQPDPEGPPNGDGRVLRGGSWIREARYLRSAFRNGYGPAFRVGDFGFRVSPGRAGQTGLAEPA